MAGHSEWHNIKHQKQKQDKKRAKLFSKLSKRITVEAREGGGDPEKNPGLRRVIRKAKDQNMPKDNIERAIKRGTGELEGVNYEQFYYEGYGPGGIALYMDITSDNRNRTASELRHILSNNGGNLGQSGCVDYMFDKKGRIVIELQDNDISEEELMLQLIELGAEDIDVQNEIATIYTAVNELDNIRDQLEEEGIEVDSSDLAMVPQNEVEIQDKNTAAKTLNLMEELEEHDDIQEVYTNFNIPEEIIKEIKEAS